MKKLCYFIPSILVFAFLVLVLLLLCGPTGQLDDYLVGAGIFLIILASDFLLSKKKWYGCIPGMVFGAYIIYYGSQYHGQIFDERPVGIVICLYYLVCAIVT